MAQRIRRRLALVVRHSVDFKLESQMLRAGQFRLLIHSDHRIGRDWLRNALDLNLPALLATHFVLHKCIGLK